MIKQFFQRLVGGEHGKSAAYTSSSAPVDGRVSSAGVFSGGASDVAYGLSAFWACVSLQSGTQASLPLRVLRRDEDGGQEAIDHPLARLLGESPNADQTALAFWQGETASIEVRGNSFAEKEVVDGRIIALRPIPAHKVKVKRLSSGDIGYSWADERGRRREGTQDSVFHIRGMGGDALGGMSTLQYAARSLGLANAQRESAESIFRNGLRAGAAITYQEWLKPEQRDQIENRIIDKYTGSLNAGRPIVLEGGVQYEQLSIAPDDAQLLEQMAFSTEEICRFFGVPPHMIFSTEKTSSWGTGLAEQTAGFVKFSLRPRLTRMEQEIRKQLLTPADRAAGITVEFSLEGLLRGSSKERSEFYRQMSQIGAMTINEIRRREGLPPVAGGDEPRIQAQNIPVSAALMMGELDNDAS